MESETGRTRKTLSDPQSSGGWSDASRDSGSKHPRLASASSARLRLEGSKRYEEEYMLGQGGMGVVHAVIDHRLGRRLALKRTRHSDVRLEARLKREIQILAALQHPGIIPLLEAGADAKGRPWYTMPKLAGRTLAEELADAQTRQERFSLLRPMLLVCQAVAHAHDQGFVHRDLKPANVIVGTKGQAFVLDWGLARWVEEAEDAPIDDPGVIITLPSAKELTAFGQVLGTPRYMSPEQTRGELAQRPSDVFALGMMLYAVGYGRVLDTEGGVVPDEAFQSGDESPPLEFVAIVRKCLKLKPELRYADAGELALDLARFIDGRRVQAHDYTGRELLRRFVGEHRMAITVGAIALVTLAVFGVGSVNQIQEEGARAHRAELTTRAALARSEASERETLAALGRADARLHDALVGQARAARRIGADPEAERFALEALALAPSPVAHGVLAAVTGVAATRELGPEIPLCDRSEFFPGGEGFVCHRGRQLSVYSMNTKVSKEQILQGVDLYRILDSHHFLVFGDGNEVEFRRRGDAKPLAEDTLVDRWYITAPRNAPTGPIWSVGQNRFLSWRAGEKPLEIVGAKSLVTCPNTAPKNWVTDDSNSAWGMCHDGSIFRLRMRATSSPLLEAQKTTITEVHTTMALGRGPGADTLYVGGRDGSVFLLDANTLTERGKLSTNLGRIRSIAVAPSGHVLALRDDVGRVELIHADDASARLRLPGSEAQAIMFDEEGHLLVARRQLETWKLPEILPTRVRRGEAGFSSVALSNDDRLIAATDGEGFVTLWSSTHNAPLWHQRWQTGVAKDCAFSTDNQRLACAAMNKGPRIWELPEREPRAVSGYLRKSYRRVAWLGDELRLFPFSGSVERVARLELVGAAPGGPGDWKDVSSAPDQSAMVRINHHDGVVRVDSVDADQYHSHVVLKRKGALAVDLGPRGEVAIAGPGARLELVDASGETHFSFDAAMVTRLLDVEISHDGGLIAASTLRGEILLWDADGQLLARLEGHQERVVKLVFSSDDSYLLSASWDKSVRRWEMQSLEQVGSELPKAHWELSLDEAMAVPGL